MLINRKTRNFSLNALLLSLFLFVSPLFASDLNFAAYYGAETQIELQNLSRDPEFRTKLFSILVSDHHPLSYKDARKKLFGVLHLDQDSRGYFVRCVYCEFDYSEILFQSKPPGPGKIPHASLINTEHTWPQSRFSKRHSKYFQKSDLHALFPTTSSANSSRGNIPFGEVGKSFTSPCSAAKRGRDAHGSVTVFEPPDSHKGNVARALFYFAVRYEMQITFSEESYLRVWHEQDPVDDEELQRNEIVYQIQGTRNPFIDQPQWANSIHDF